MLYVSILSGSRSNLLLKYHYSRGMYIYWQHEINVKKASTKDYAFTVLNNIHFTNICTFTIYFHSLVLNLRQVDLGFKTEAEEKAEMISLFSLLKHSTHMNNRFTTPPFLFC